MATEDRGFASMSEDKQRKIASEGGKASGENFANNRRKASEAGKKGAENQPIEAKRKGGEHSHGGGRQYSSYKRELLGSLLYSFMI